MTQCACGRPLRDAYLCGRCTGQLRGLLTACHNRRVTDMHGREVTCAGLITELTWAVAKLTRIDGGRAPRVEADPDAHLPLTAAMTSSPMNLGASMALSDLRAKLHSWSRALAEESGTNVTGHPSEFLAANVESIRLREWGPDAWGELTKAVIRAEQIIDRPADEVFAGICPGDDGKPCGVELWATPGAVIVQCCACRTQWDVAEVRTWLLRTAEDQLLTAADIARAMSVEGRQVTVNTVYGWVQYDKRRAARGGPAGLTPVTIDKKGRPLYRLGDALNRWDESQGIGAVA